MHRAFLDRSHRDIRINSILNSLKNLSNSESPEVKHIIQSMQEMQDHFLQSDEQMLHYEQRVNDILDVLLHYTLMDFSVQAKVGNTGDDLDAIAVGINTLAEELQDRIRKEVENSEKLHEQNVRLERTNKELASFAYVSSHDLQEPLRKINTYISRLMQEEIEHLPEQAKFFLERIHSSAVRMQNLIKDILEYSKLSAIDEKLETVDLNTVAAECRDEFEDALREKNGILTFHNLCEVKVVPFQLKRVLNNLIGNSIKFSDPSRPLQITLTSRIVDANELNFPELFSAEKYCHLSYKDNGIGFSKAYNEKIFGIFQRLHNQSDYQGTGVGLAICKRIIENHEGLIIADGEDGKGAKFEIYLPA